MPETLDKRVRRDGELVVEAVAVYAPDEPLPPGIEPVPWREAEARGQWVHTDDGYAVEAFRVNGPYQHGTGALRREVVTVAGVAWTDSRQVLLWEREREWARETLSLTQKRRWSALEARKGRTKRAVAAAVQMIVSGEGIDYETIGRIFRPHEARPAASARRLLKQREVKQMLTDKVAEHFEAQGLSAATVPEVLKAAYDAAKEKGDARALIEIARELEEYFPSKPTKTKQTEEQWDFGAEMLREANASGDRQQARLAERYTSSEREDYDEETL